MAFTSDLADLVADQLTKFATLQRHQLAGQVANLDFWISQTRNALEAIEGYPLRFERLRTAQRKYAEAHDSKLVVGDFEHRTELVPPALKRVSGNEMHAAEMLLREAVYRLLARCVKEGLLPESEMRAECGRLEIGVDAADLKKME